MRFYVARYSVNGKIEYWSGRGTMFTEEKRNAAKFDLSNAMHHATVLEGFLEAA